MFRAATQVQFVKSIYDAIRELVFFLRLDVDEKVLRSMVWVHVIA
jgi:hypothetical protein